MNYFLHLFYILFVSCRSFLSQLFWFIFNPSFTAPSLSGESVWMKGSDLPKPRTELVAVNLGGEVYVIGGFTLDGKITEIVEMYNSTDNTWVQNIKSLPIPFHHASADTYGGKIYVAGGYTGNWIPSNNLFIYDPATNNWTLGNPCLHHEVYRMQVSLMESCM